MKKSIALFGATGKTGREFLKIALADGYHVKALVREPLKLKESGERLDVIKGDVLNDSDVERCISDTDVVVSLFGHVKGSPELLQTRGTQNILRSMQHHGLHRIILLSGGGLPYPEKDKPGLPDRIIRGIMKIFFRKILDDAIRHAKVLQNSDRDWTIVRAPRLTVEDRRNEYRVGWVGVNAGTSIGRKDLADFILKELKENQFSNQMPFVSY